MSSLMGTTGFPIMAVPLVAISLVVVAINICMRKKSSDNFDMVSHKTLINSQSTLVYYTRLNKNY